MDAFASGGEDTPRGGAGGAGARAWRSIGFVGTLGLGAVVALALVVGQVALGPWLGSGVAAELVLWASLVAYSALLASTLRGRVRNAAVALAAGLIVVLLARGLGEVAVGFALTLALVRGVIERSQRPLRAVLIECSLGVVGLCLARWLAVPGLFGAAAGFWGYALTQSLYFLAPGRSRRCVQGVGDPFERAREQLDALLDGT